MPRPGGGRWSGVLRLASVAVLAAAIAALATGLATTPRAGAAPAMPQAEVVVQGVTFRVDVADTPATQARGLGGRRRLGPTDGMLFVYAERQRHSFWMRGMRIPIDMIWLDNRRVVHIEHDVPPPGPGMTVRDLPTYQPDVPANFVLEVAAGRARALGLQVGDTVRFRFNVR